MGWSAGLSRVQNIKKILSLQHWISKIFATLAPPVNHVREESKQLPMPVKIRLARHGKKHQPFYHIVVADSRAPRDGRFIEKIGIYNPLTHPITLEINTEKALHWLERGAQPTDTCRSLLSQQGVLYRRHLNLGVKKGALTQEQADARFAEWLEQKKLKIARIRQAELNAKKEALKRQQAEEARVRKKIEERIAAKRIARSEMAAAAAVEAARQAEANHTETERPEES
jgi:small subunit ribosomal protein S16